jgi:hypothetical protein
LSVLRVLKEEGAEIDAVSPGDFFRWVIPCFLERGV